MMFKVKNLIFGVSILLINACNSKEEIKSDELNHNPNRARLHNFKISFFKDKSFSTSNFDTTQAIFTTGFDTPTNFIVFKNIQFVKKFSGETNYSIGICCDENKKYCTFNFSLKKIMAGDSIKIKANDELAVLIMPKDFHSYNRLTIYRDSINWFAAFENSNESRLLE